MANEVTLPGSGSVEIVSGKPPLTVLYAPRTMTMHSVSTEELNTISSLGNSIHLTFFGVCIGAALAFWSVLLSVPNMEPRPHATYALLFAASCLFSVYFGARAAVDYRRARKKLADVKNALPVVS